MVDRWRCLLLTILAVFLPKIAQLASAQDVSTDTDIYSNDDLILVNPIQSSGVLLCIIAASTLIEFIFGRFAKVRNRYLRVIYVAIREELTVISFGVMALQFVVNSFPSVSPEWRVVVEWVAICVVYLGFMYCASVSAIVFILKLRSKAWRTFEWARIDADSHHSQSEQVFKLARKYFVMQIAGRLDEMRSEMASIPPVAFSSFVTLLECDNLRELLSFSIKTWLILAVLIFANATRSMTIASIDDDSRVTPHIISFMAILGYLVLAIHLFVVFYLQHRVRAFTIQQLDPAQYDRDADAPRDCLWFGAEKHTLEVLKATLLAIMWYTCVFAICFGYVAYAEYGPIAILIYIVAAIPPVAVVVTIPFALNLVTFCSAMATARRDQAIEHLTSGGIVHDDVPSSEDDSDDEDLDARVKVSKRDTRTAMDEDYEGRPTGARGGGAGGGDGGSAFLNAADYDETEYNGPSVLLNGVDGGLLEANNGEEEEMVDRSKTNHFGYAREEEGGDEYGNGFHESRVYFRD